MKMSYLFAIIVSSYHSNMHTQSEAPVVAVTLLKLHYIRDDI